MSRKRETDGKYAHEGNWHRLCVCGHSLGVHAAESPADCLLYSFAESDPIRLKELGAADCGCKKFRLSRKRTQ